MFDLANAHHWTIGQVLNMTTAEYEGWWEYHRRHGDCKRGG